MKIKYDRETDTMTVVFNTGMVQESDETHDGIILDYGMDGRLISMEILDASQRVEQPDLMEYQVQDRKTA
jgi:uncharacterized protein YuzE